MGKRKSRKSTAPGLARGLRSEIKQHPNSTRRTVADVVAKEMRRLTELAEREPLPCMGCHMFKLWPRGQISPAIYQPLNPAYRAISYLICDPCASDKKKRKRAYLAAETISRADAEGVFE